MLSEACMSDATELRYTEREDIGHQTPRSQFHQKLTLKLVLKLST